jgi:hypothetical protein
MVWASLRVATTVALGLTGTFHAAAQNACNCDDVIDLQGRYCQARMAVSEWDQLIEWSKRREAREGKEEKFTFTTKDEVKLCVDEAIGMVQAQFTGNGSTSKVGTRWGTGGTDDRTCKVTVNAPTACLRDVLTQHEHVHENVCRATIAPNAPPPRDYGFINNLVVKYVDWRLATSLITYMTEERTAYSTEMADILKKLSVLEGRCPKSPFERQTKDGMKFSLTPCPRPDPEEYRKSRQCKRLL